MFAIQPFSLGTVMKTWELFVLGLALVVFKTPEPACFKTKFSSSNIFSVECEDAIQACESWRDSVKGETLVTKSFLSMLRVGELPTTSGTVSTKSSKKI